MTTTVVKPNENNFSEVTLNDKQPLVTNNLGRAAVHMELVYLGGYFGEVKEYGGIANAATGRINIDSNRTIRTEQVEATDTFTAGNVIWFKSGGAGAAGTLVDANSGTDYAAGIITEEEGAGGAQTSVTFRPFAQRLDAADVSAQVITNTAGIATNVTGIADNVTDIATNTAALVTINAEPKTLVQKIVADASSGIAVSGLVEGDEIIGVRIICTVAETNGTLKVTDGSPADITDAIICAVDKVATEAGTIDDGTSTLPASGAVIIAAGDTAANTRGIVIIDYIPA